MANELYVWRGAVEPSEATPNGNEIQLWRGAVEPQYIPPNPTRGKSPKKSRRDIPRFVELPNGEFVQVANEQEADEIRAMFEKAKQAEQPTQSVKTKSVPKMTPEIERALAKLRKQPKEVTRGSSLLGKKRGFL